MNRCPASPNCPYCDANDEHERAAEQHDLDAMIEAHDRPQSEEDCPQ